MRYHLGSNYWYHLGTKRKHFVLRKKLSLIEIRVHWTLTDASAEYFPIFKIQFSTHNMLRYTQVLFQIHRGIWTLISNPRK